MQDRIHCVIAKQRLKLLPLLHLAPHTISKVLHVFKYKITETQWKNYQEKMARKPEHQNCYRPPFFLYRQISS